MAKLTKRVGENITYNQERKIECSVYCDECPQGTANCKTIREMVKKLADYEDAEEQKQAEQEQKEPVNETETKQQEFEIPDWMQQ